MPQTGKKRIKSIALKTAETPQPGCLIARDQTMALEDLKHESLFHPADDKNGPYHLCLSIQDNRLLFEMRDDGDNDLPMLILSLKPYKRLIKDYFLIVESYVQCTIKNPET